MRGNILVLPHALSASVETNRLKTLSVICRLFAW